MLISRILSLFLVVLFMTVAYVYKAPLVIIGVFFLFLLTELKADLSFKQGFKRFDVSTAYIFALILCSISHFVTLLVYKDFELEDIFFCHGVPAYINEAAFIFSLGSLITLISLRLMYSKVEKKIEYVPDHLDNKWFLFLLILSVSLYNPILCNKNVLSFLGSFQSVLRIIPLGGIFYLSYLCWSLNSKKIYFVLLIVIISSLQLLTNAYLRAEMLMPWLAYFLGELLFKRKLQKFSFVSKIILFLMLILLPLVFAFIGNNRYKVFGKERTNALLTYMKNKESYKDAKMSRYILLARFSVLAPISQIVDLTKDDKFYRGETLQYYSYVFIPRVVWSQKPEIKQGQWFALESDSAVENSSGEVNNSINMTVPGELYLNYGWFGVIIGCVLFGCFIGWISNLFHYDNLLGWVFNFYLLFLGFFSLGADLQIVPTLIAYLLIYFLYSRYLIFRKRWVKR